MKKLFLVILATAGFAASAAAQTPVPAPAPTYYTAQPQRQDVGLSRNQEARLVGKAVGKPSLGLGKWLASIAFGVPQEFGNTTAGFIETTVHAVPKITQGTGKGIGKYLGDKVGDDR